MPDKKNEQRLKEMQAKLKSRFQAMRSSTNTSPQADSKKGNPTMPNSDGSDSKKSILGQPNDKLGKRMSEYTEELENDPDLQAEVDKLDDQIINEELEQLEQELAEIDANSTEQSRNKGSEKEILKRDSQIGPRPPNMDDIPVYVESGNTDGELEGYEDEEEYDGPDDGFEEEDEYEDDFEEDDSLEDGEAEEVEDDPDMVRRLSEKEERRKKGIQLLINESKGNTLSAFNKRLELVLESDETYLLRWDDARKLHNILKAEDPSAAVQQLKTGMSNRPKSIFDLETGQKKGEKKEWRSNPKNQKEESSELEKIKSKSEKIIADLLKQEYIRIIQEDLTEENRKVIKNLVNAQSKEDIIGVLERNQRLNVGVLKEYIKHLGVKDIAEIHQAAYQKLGELDDVVTLAKQNDKKQKLNNGDRIPKLIEQMSLEELRELNNNPVIPYEKIGTKAGGLFGQGNYELSENQKKLIEDKLKIVQIIEKGILVLNAKVLKEFNKSDSDKCKADLAKDPFNLKDEEIALVTGGMIKGIQEFSIKIKQKQDKMLRKVISIIRRKTTKNSRDPVDYAVIETLDKIAKAKDKCQLESKVLGITKAQAKALPNDFAALQKEARKLRVQLLSMLSGDVKLKLKIRERQENPILFTNEVELTQSQLLRLAKIPVIDQSKSNLVKSNSDHYECLDIVREGHKKPSSIYLDIDKQEFKDIIIKSAKAIYLKRLVDNYEKNPQKITQLLALDDVGKFKSELAKLLSKSGLDTGQIIGSGFKNLVDNIQPFNMEEIKQDIYQAFSDNMAPFIENKIKNLELIETEVIEIINKDNADIKDKFKELAPFIEPEKEEHYKAKLKERAKERAAQLIEKKIDDLLKSNDLNQEFIRLLNPSPIKLEGSLKTYLGEGLCLANEDKLIPSDRLRDKLNLLISINTQVNSKSKLDKFKNVRYWVTDKLINGNYELLKEPAKNWAQRMYLSELNIERIAQLKAIQYIEKNEYLGKITNMETLSDLKILIEGGEVTKSTKLSFMKDLRKYLGNETVTIIPAAQTAAINKVGVLIQKASIEELVKINRDLNGVLSTEIGDAGITIEQAIQNKAQELAQEKIKQNISKLSANQRTSVMNNCQADNKSTLQYIDTLDLGRTKLRITLLGEGLNKVLEKTGITIEEIQLEEVVKKQREYLKKEILSFKLENLKDLLVLSLMHASPINPPCERQYGQSKWAKDKTQELQWAITSYKNYYSNESYNDAKYKALASEICKEKIQEQATKVFAKMDSSKAKKVEDILTGDGIPKDKLDAIKSAVFKAGEQWLFDHIADGDKEELFNELKDRFEASPEKRVNQVLQATNFQEFSPRQLELLAARKKLTLADLKVYFLQQQEEGVKIPENLIKKLKKADVVDGDVEVKISKEIQKHASLSAGKQIEAEIIEWLREKEDPEAPGELVVGTLTQEQVISLFVRDKKLLIDAFQQDDETVLEFEPEVFNALEQDYQGKVKLPEDLNSHIKNEAARIVEEELVNTELKFSQIRALTAKDAKFKDCKHLFKNNQDLYQLLEAAGDLDIPKEMQDDLRNIDDNDLKDLINKTTSLQELLDIHQINFKLPVQIPKVENESNVLISSANPANNLDIEAIEKELKEVKNIILGKNNEIEGIKKERSGIEIKVEIKNEIESLNEKILNKKNFLDLMSSELTALKTNDTNLSSSLARLDASDIILKGEKLVTTITKFEGEVQQYQEKIQELEKQLEELNNLVEEKEGELKALVEKEQELLGRVASLKNETLPLVPDESVDPPVDHDKLLIHQILNHPRPGIIDSFSQKKSDYDAVVEEFKKPIAILEGKTKDLSARMEAKLAQLNKPINITQPGESSTQLNKAIKAQMNALAAQIKSIESTLGENPKDNSYLASVVKELESQITGLVVGQKELQSCLNTHQISNGQGGFIKVDTEALHALVLSGWDDSGKTLFNAVKFEAKWNEIFPEQSLDDNADLGAIHQAAADKFMDVLLESKSPAELEECLSNINDSLEPNYINAYMPMFLNPDKLNSVKPNDNKAYSALVSQVMASGDSASASASAKAAIIARVTSARNKAVAKEFIAQFNDKNITPKKLVELNKKYGDLSKVTVEIGRETKTYKDHIKAKAIDLAMQKLESIVGEPKSDSDLTKNADARDKIIVSMTDNGDSVQSVLGKELSSLYEPKELIRHKEYSNIVKSAFEKQQKYVQHKFRKLSPKDLKQFLKFNKEQQLYDTVYKNNVFNLFGGQSKRLQNLISHLESNKAKSVKEAVINTATDKLVQSAPAIFTQHENKFKDQFKGFFSSDDKRYGKLIGKLKDTKVFDEHLLECLADADDNQLKELYEGLEQAYKANPQERINHAIQAIKLVDLTVEQIALITSGQAKKEQLKIAFVNSPKSDNAKVDPVLIEALGNDDNETLTFSKETIQQAQEAAVQQIHKILTNISPQSIPSSPVLTGEQIKALHSRDLDSLINAFSSSAPEEGSTPKLIIPLELFKALEKDSTKGKVKLSEDINVFKQEQAQAYIQNIWQPKDLTLSQRNALVAKGATYDGCKALFDKNLDLYSIFEAAGKETVDKSVKNKIIESEFNLEAEIKNDQNDLTRLMYIRNVYFDSDLNEKIKNTIIESTITRNTDDDALGNGSVLTEANLRIHNDQVSTSSDDSSHSSDGPLSDTSSEDSPEYFDASLEADSRLGPNSDQASPGAKELLIYKVLSQPTPFRNGGYTPSIASMQSDVQRFYSEMKDKFDETHKISTLTDNKHVIMQMEQTAKNITSPPKAKQSQVLPVNSSNPSDIRKPYHYSTVTSKVSEIENEISTIRDVLKASQGKDSKPSHYLDGVIKRLEAEKNKLQASINKVNKAAYAEKPSLIAQDVSALLLSSPKLSDNKIVRQPKRSKLSMSLISVANRSDDETVTSDSSSVQSFSESVHSITHENDVLSLDDAESGFSGLNRIGPSPLILQQGNRRSYLNSAGDSAPFFNDDSYSVMSDISMEDFPPPLFNEEQLKVILAPKVTVEQIKAAFEKDFPDIVNIVENSGLTGIVDSDLFFGQLDKSSLQQDIHASIQECFDKIISQGSQKQKQALTELWNPSNTENVADTDTESVSDKDFSTPIIVYTKDNHDKFVEAGIPQTLLNALSDNTKLDIDITNTSLSFYIFSKATKDSIDEIYNVQEEIDQSQALSDSMSEPGEAKPEGLVVEINKRNQTFAGILKALNIKVDENDVNELIEDVLKHKKYITEKSSLKQDDAIDNEIEIKAGSLFGENVSNALLLEFSEALNSGNEVVRNSNEENARNNGMLTDAVLNDLDSSDLETFNNAVVILNIAVPNNPFNNSQQGPKLKEKLLAKNIARQYLSDESLEDKINNPETLAQEIAKLGTDGTTFDEVVAKAKPYLKPDTDTNTSTNTLTRMIKFKAIALEAAKGLAIPEQEMKALSPSDAFRKVLSTAVESKQPLKNLLKIKASMEDKDVFDKKAKALFNEAVVRAGKPMPGKTKVAARVLGVAASGAATIGVTLLSGGWGAVTTPVIIPAAFDLGVAAVAGGTLGAHSNKISDSTAETRKLYEDAVGFINDLNERSEQTILDAFDKKQNVDDEVLAAAINHHLNLSGDNKIDENKARQFHSGNFAIGRDGKLITLNPEQKKQQQAVNAFQNRGGSKLKRVVQSKKFQDYKTLVSALNNSQDKVAQQEAVKTIQKEISQSKTPREALQTLKATVKNVAHIKKAVSSLENLSAASIRKEFSAEKRKAIKQSVEDYDSIVQKHSELEDLIKALGQPTTPVAKEQLKKLEAEKKALEALLTDERIQQHEEMLKLVKVFHEKIDHLEVISSPGITISQINNQDIQGHSRQANGFMKCGTPSVQKVSSKAERTEDGFVIKAQLNEQHVTKKNEQGNPTNYLQPKVPIQITLSEDNTKLVTIIEPISHNGGPPQTPVLTDEQLKTLAWQEATIYISENGPPTKDKPLYLLPGTEPQSVQMNAYRYAAVKELCKNMKQASAKGNDTNHYNPDCIFIKDPNSRKLAQQFDTANPFEGDNHDNEIAKQTSQIDKSCGDKELDPEKYKEAKASVKAVSKMFGTTSSFFKDTKLKYSAIREKAESKGNEKDQDNEHGSDHSLKNK